MVCLLGRGRSVVGTEGVAIVTVSWFGLSLDGEMRFRYIHIDRKRRMAREGRERDREKDRVKTHRNRGRLHDGDLAWVKVDVAIGFRIAELGLDQLWELGRAGSEGVTSHYLSKHASRSV